jgi:RNA polymerase sigma-70 factor, ECF subfamily
MSRISPKQLRQESGPAAQDTQGDAPMIAKLRNGDAHSHDQLMRALAPRVLSVARRYLRSDADADDCCQETFMVVLQQIHAYRGEGSLWQWIKGIAVKQCLMRLRQHRRRGEDSIDELLPVFDERGRRLSVPQDPVAVSVEAMDTGRVIHQALARLPDDYRVILVLRDIDGYTTGECASMLGLSVNAAKTRLHRARAALRTLLLPVLRVGPAAG